ncbi:sugar phosphate isomerase/epimerase family protein [Fodinibius sp. Rm-B-1B1-1]|uniref:sugar phosphate isomerase/epimerase family protein n=1 Tax=Fodinibius alkaliphilus TaxID=3140241 RepID=UPI00315AB149
MDRKKFLQLGSFAAASVGIPGILTAAAPQANPKDLFFDISLAQWSLHRALFDGKIDHLEFPQTAKNEFGITAVEYVNQFFADKAEDKSYLDEMNSRCEDLGVDQVLIMVDGEGDLAIQDDKKRIEGVENHYKWVEAAQHLGCHSIRVNLYGDGTAEEQKRAAVDSLGRLAEFARDYNINIAVENHGGYSSDGQWLVDVMKQVNMDNCGTLPDFGNFCVKRENDARWDGACIEKYDRYQGVKELMSFAKGVSAKSYAFGENGLETTIDFTRMLNIIHKAGYSGYIGVEYEGDKHNEYDGIQATKELLIKLGQEF